MRFPKIPIGYGSKLFFSHLLAVFLVSGSVGSYFYLEAMEGLMKSLQSRLQNSAALLSRVIDVRDLELIRTPGDTNSPLYLANLEKLRAIRRVNPDIAFLYVMRREGNQVSFVIDSDDSEAQAMPGRIYQDFQPDLLAGFHQPSVDDQPYRDEWGTFLSGYSPIFNGEGRYLLGIDMRADEVDRKLSELRMTGLISLLISILLALGLAHWLSKGLMRRIELLTESCRKFTLGRFDGRIEDRPVDEFGELIDAFNTMGEELGKAKRQSDLALKSLQEAKDGLEDRVQARAQEFQSALARLNVMRGLLPICASCKKIRDDQGYWQQVEDFVQDHTEVQFSHGLCPTCMRHYYGDLLIGPNSDPSGPVPSGAGNP